MSLKAGVTSLCIPLLALIPSASAQASATPKFQIAQAGAKETLPGGVEHQPTMEPDAAMPRGLTLPEPTPSPPATESAEPPPVAAPSATDAGSQEKKDTTGPTNSPK